MRAAELPLASDDSEILQDGAYGQVDEWEEMGPVMRVVVGADRQVHALGGVYIRHMSTDGVEQETTRVEGLREIDVDEEGNLFGATTNEIMRLRRGEGTVQWRKVIPSDPHEIVGPRPPYITSIAHNAFTANLQVLYDAWDPSRTEAYNLAFLGLWSQEFGNRKNGHALANDTHQYWDQEVWRFDDYFLNRSNNMVEVYNSGDFVKEIPLPAPAERIAIGPDGSVFFTSERQWVYRVDQEGRMLDIWDATDPSPERKSWVSDLDVDAIGRVYVADEAKATVRVYAPLPGRSPIDPPVQRFHCRTRPDKWADPTYLQLGEKTTVTLRLGGDCPALYEKADIMLVVDRSNSMSNGSKIVFAQEAVRTFVNLMDLERDQIGMVMYQSQPELLVQLTQDRQSILDQIPRLSPVGGTDIKSALELALPEVLGPRHRPDAKPIIVLLTDGVPFNNTRNLTLEMADRVRNAGVTMYTIGLGADADPNLLKIMARSTEHYFYAPLASDLAEIYRKIARQISASVLLKEVTVTDYVPKNMAYIEGSASDGGVWDAPNRTITWRFTNVPFTGVQMSFQVEPLEVGQHPTNIGADYIGEDGLDQPAQDLFPIPEVIVVSPTINTPTPSPTLPSPTPVPSVTPTVPEPPPPPIKPVIYLPIVFNDKCFQTHTDVVLILDASTTMEGRMGDGRIKLEGAKDAARAFIDMLQLHEDQLRLTDHAAIVWYNDIARTAQVMTNDRAKLMAAIDNIPLPQEGSRIDLGLQYAHQEIIARTNRRQRNQPAVVLLSDGEPNRTTLEAVYAAADELKREGARIFSVGFKDNYYREYVLRYIASGPEDYFFAPRAEDLAGIYRRIAGELVCH